MSPEMPAAVPDGGPVRPSKKSRRERRVATSNARGRAPRRRGGAVAAEPVALAPAAALVAGAVSLASEVVWTRALVFFVHNSTYAFSAILAVYLLGIAAGALLAARLARTRLRSPRGSWRRRSCRERVRPRGGDRDVPAPSRGRGAAGRRASASRRAPGRRPSDGDGRSWSWGRTRSSIIFAQAAAVLFLPAALPRGRLPRWPSSSPRRASGRPRSWAASTRPTPSGASRAPCSAPSCSWRFSGREGRSCCWPGSRCPSPSGPCTHRSRRRGRGSCAAALVAALAGSPPLAAPRGFYQQLFEKRFGQRASGSRRE